MTNSYAVGPEARDITLEVKISSPGFAISRIERKNLGEHGEEIAESPKNGIGDVPKSTIPAKTIATGSTIEIETIIVFEGFVPEEQWPSCFDNLVCRYSFSGGPDGSKKFLCDPDDKKKSKSGGTITISKSIQLLVK